MLSVLPAFRLPRLFAAALLAGGLAGCVRQEACSTAGHRVVVDYWEKWSGFESDAMQAVIDDFNRGQDRIEVDFLSVNQVDLKLLLAASSGHPPDAAGLWSYNLPDFSGHRALLRRPAQFHRGHRADRHQGMTGADLPDRSAAQWL